MKRTIIFILFTGSIIVIKAQDKVEATISADIVSQYIWRGQELGNASFQPSLGIAYKNLSLSAWGSVGLVDASDTKEIDLTLAYTLGSLNIGITDYWVNDGLDPKNRYFKYDAHGTNHLFEAKIGYDFGVVAFQWYTNFTGNDGTNKDGKRAYSSYFEISAPFKLATCDWVATTGFVPYATDFYDTSGFSMTNLSLRATKDIKVTNSFIIPIFGELSANPCSQKAYLTFGFTLKQ